MAEQDVFCFVCNRAFPSREHPARYDASQERLCPRCGSDFVELVDAVRC